MGRTNGQVRRRPAWLRALGNSEPPEQVVAAGVVYRRESVLKHDSWAATASYLSEHGHRAAIKFNRRQSFYGLPMGWIGRGLARRELGVLRQMAEVEGFPREVGPVLIDGRSWPNVAAHEWIEGHPFHAAEPADDEFFPRLRAMLAALHARGIAYVDLGKAENILVGDDGRPYLLDYQIHYRRRWWDLSGGVLRSLQATDLYHLHKHWSRARPDQLTPEELELDRYRPWVVRVAHRVQPHLRRFRRGILVRLGVRQGDGRARHELEPEEAVRRQLERDQP